MVDPRLYLSDAGFRIVEHKRTDVPRYGIRADGYSAKSGAPTSYLVRIDGGALTAADAKRWRRVLVWQWSNVGTAFVRICGNVYFLRDSDLP